MATEAQISANRRNSQKSTGPRTAEGKESVSQNAFKHGLFVNKAVVRDESQEEYDLHRQALLAEIEPVGVMESIVAGRLVNLTWRLQRAQRMQNQSIEYLALQRLDTVTGDDIKTLYRRATDQSWDEPDVPSDHLLLGRLATRDWSYARVLDRMLLYERRIENSMYKTMGELKKIQKARKAEQAATAEQQSGKESPPAHRHSGDLKKQSQSPAIGRKPEALNLKSETIAAHERKGKLKKQSQFAADHMTVTSVDEVDYDDRLPAGAAANKANQSQFGTGSQAHPPVKGEIAAALRASQ